MKEPLYYLMLLVYYLMFIIKYLLYFIKICCILVLLTKGGFTDDRKRSNP